MALLLGWGVLLGVITYVPVEAQISGTEEPPTFITPLPSSVMNDPRVYVRVMAEAIDRLCPQLTPTVGSTEDLRMRCTELVAPTFSTERPPGVLTDIRNGLAQMAYEEVVSQGSNAVKTSNMQFGTVGARLAALRGGATGISIRGLASNFTPAPILLASLTSNAGNLASDAGAGGGIIGGDKGRWSKFGLFLDGEFAFGNKDATSREAGFDFRSAGGTVGLDYRFTRQFVLGGAFGYGTSKVDLDANGGDVDTDSYALSLYGTYYVSDAWYIDGIFTVGWSDFDSTRNIEYGIAGVPGLSSSPQVLVRQTARADTDGRQFAFSFGSGYDWHTGALTYGPYARINYIQVAIDAFRERINNSNAGFGLALSFENQTVVSFTTILGGQASYAISTPVGVLVPQLRVEWEHELSYDRRTVVARFIADPNREAIRIPTDNPDRDFVNVGAGVSMVFAGQKSAFLSYQTVLGLRDITAHNFVLGVRMAF